MAIGRPPWPSINIHGHPGPSMAMHGHYLDLHFDLDVDISPAPFLSPIADGRNEELPATGDEWRRSAEAAVSHIPAEPLWLIGV